jgi:hypothetical protein
MATPRRCGRIPYASRRRSRVPEPKPDENKPADPAEGQEPAAEEQEPKPAEGEQAPADDEAKAEDEKADDTTLDEDGAKAALAKVRKEAAASRTKLREIEKALAEATSPEKLEELVQKLKADSAAESRALVVENVALKFKLSDEAAEFLKGDTREELEASAAKLAKLMPAEEEPGDDPDLSGGLTPGGDTGTFDPVAIAREARKNRW